MILSIYTSLAKMDKALINASYDLGANQRQTFMKVTFPLSPTGGYLRGYLGLLTGRLNLHHSRNFWEVANTC
jgi:ABC-type molybdate transport system permease subunit